MLSQNARANHWHRLAWRTSGNIVRVCSVTVNLVRARAVNLVQWTSLRLPRSGLASLWFVASFH